MTSKQLYFFYIYFYIDNYNGLIVFKFNIPLIILFLRRETEILISLACKKFEIKKCPWYARLGLRDIDNKSHWSFPQGADVISATIFGDSSKMKREYYSGALVVCLLFIDIFMVRFNHPSASPMAAPRYPHLAKSVYDLWHFSLVAYSSAYRLLQFTLLVRTRTTRDAM